MDRRMLSCLAVLAASGIVACADAPLEVQQRDVSLATLSGTDSVALTYMCGNMFRVRNSSFEPRNVRWDIYNASPADTGSLVVRGRDLGSTSVDYFVTSRTKGTMRLFVGATLIATKANGNKAACAAPVDTSAFPSTESIGKFDFFGQPFLVRADSTIDARTMVLVQFAASASSADKRALQRSLGAQIVRVWTASLVRFRVPDPGNEQALMDSLLARIRANPTVLSAQFTQLRGKVITRGGARFPTDGLGQARADHVSPSQRTWAAHSTRLPQAWWCETGAYGAIPARVAVVEANIGAIPTDLGAAPGTSLFKPTLPNEPPESTPDFLRDTVRDHAAAVLGVLGSRGDNGVGIAGSVWRGDFRLFSLQATSSSGASLEIFIDYYLPEIRAANPRILSLSSDFAVIESSTIDPFQSAAFTRRLIATLAVRALLDSLPQLLVVQSAGNDSTLGPPENVPDARFTAMQGAFIGLKRQGYGGRIMSVGATDRAGNRAGFSNELSGALDIYAPGDSIISLNAAGFPTWVSGTSFAAPIVAGFGAQLLSMDPTLTAAEVKQLLLAGARDSVENAVGDNVLPNKVGNTYDDVYEADSYGSLRLLSSRAGRPLCGAEVTSRRQYTGTVFINSPSFSVLVRRYGASAPEVISTDFSNAPLIWQRSYLSHDALSLAPGGRAISVSSGKRFQNYDAIPQSYRTNTVELRAGQWQATRTDSSAVGMYFGERDTLLVGVTGATFASTSGRTVVPFDQGAFSVPGGNVSFAPDGSRFAYTEDTQSGPQLVVISRNASVQRIQLSTNTLDRAARTTWTADSRNILATLLRQAGTAVNVDWYGVYGEQTSVHRVSAISTLALQNQIVVLPFASYAYMESLRSTPEGGRFTFRLVGEHYFQPAPLQDYYENYYLRDCSQESLRSRTLDGQKQLFEITSGNCRSSSRPTNGGPFEIGRIQRHDGLGSAGLSSMSIRRATP
jgi:Subtilase family